MILCLATSAEYWLVTDKHTTTAYIMLAWRCAVKTGPAKQQLSKIYTNPESLKIFFIKKQQQLVNIWTQMTVRMQHISSFNPGTPDGRGVAPFTLALPVSNDHWNASG